MFAKLWNWLRGRQMVRAEGVESPNGLKVGASVGPAQEALPQSNDRLEIIDKQGSYDYPCGHTGAESYVVYAYGIQTKALKKSNLCPDCRLKEASEVIIRCCLCGLPIFPGEGVVLYQESSSVRKEIGKKVGDSYLGCMRWDCCPSGGFFAGHWTGLQFLPAFGGRTGAEEAFATGKMIVSNP